LATSYPLLLNPNGGNVGIGTTGPDVKLEVNGGADGSVVFGGRSDGGNGNNRRFNLIAYADGGGANYGGGLKIQTRDSVNVFQDRITVQSNGNVGIGNTAPAHKLQVQSSAAGQIATIYDTGTNGGAMYNGAAVLSVSRRSNGSTSLNGEIFRVGRDNSDSATYNVSDSFFTVRSDSVVVNESSADIDFRVESDNDSSALFVDASADAVYLRQHKFASTPTSTNNDFVHFNTGSTLVNQGSSATVNLFIRSASGSAVPCAGTAYVSCEASGQNVSWSYIIDFFYSNSTFTTTARATGNSQGTATCSVQENGVGVSCTVAYGGGLGGNMKFNASGFANVGNY
jgi:hypothetical protein